MSKPSPAFGLNGVGGTPPRRSRKFLPDPLQICTYGYDSHNEKADQSSTLRNYPAESAQDLEHDPYQILPREWFDDRYAPAQASKVDRLFRHSFWEASRERTRRAMVDAGVPATRRYRFQECGAKSIVKIDTNTGRVAVHSTCCHDRWCRACGRTRRRRLARALTERIPKAKCLAVVLTPVSTKELLQVQFERLIKNFANLRRSRWWKARVEGGAWVFEMTYNRVAGTWHPHVHLLVHAEWLQLQELSEAWHKVTGDSHRVHVSLVRPNKAGSAVHELCKYVGKIAHRSWEHDRKLMVEAIKALHSRRLVSTFGNWRDLKLSEDADPDPNSAWVVWGSLDKLFALNDRGDDDARAIMKAILTGLPLVVPAATPSGSPGSRDEHPPP